MKPKSGICAIFEKYSTKNVVICQAALHKNHLFGFSFL